MLRKISVDGAAAFAHLVALHGHRCWFCDSHERLEVDHARPLWSLDADERLDLWWWLPFNLQVLCYRCHLAKSGHESRVRAHWKKTGELLLEAL